MCLLWFLPSCVKHTMTLVDRKLYVFGGSYTKYDEKLGTEQEMFNDLLVFDTGMVECVVD